MAPALQGRPGPLRTLLLYLGLVCLPLAGLAAVVHAGQRLRAPVSVGGAWTVQAVDAGGAGGCAALAPGAPLVVTQSGVYVTVALGGAADGVAVATRLEGDSLAGTVPAWEACPSLADGAWTAAVDRTAAPHRMVGRILPRRGEPVRFVAARRAAVPPAGAEGH